MTNPTELMSQVIKLESLASPLPDSNGFRSGMSDNRNAIELEFGQMLYGLVLSKKPETVVEIGTGPGYSASWILAGLEINQFGHLYTMDVNKPDPAVWETIGLPQERLTALSEMSRPIPKKIPKKIDVLFHDGSHDWFNDIVHDFKLYLSRVPKGGIVLLHDIVFREHMGEEAKKYFDARESEWKWQEVSSGCGMLIAERIATQKGKISKSILAHASGVSAKDASKMG